MTFKGDGEANKMSGVIAGLLLRSAPPALLAEVGLSEESRHEFEQRFDSCPRRRNALDLTEASADVLYYVLEQCSALHDTSQIDLRTLTKLVQYVKLYEFDKAKEAVEDVYTLHDLAGSRERMAAARTKKTDLSAGKRLQVAQIWQTLLKEGRPPNGIAELVANRTGIPIRTIRSWKKNGKLDIELPSS